MLTQSQLGFFARNGFLHVEGVVAPEICRALVDHTWTRLPKSWSREDRSTWTGTAEDSCHVADLKVRRGLFQFQKGDLIDNPIVAKGFAAGSRCAAIGRELIGHRLAKMRLRGLYCIAPLPDSIVYKALARPHIESHAAQLVLLCYLEDVAPGGGALYVWPGSHRDIYPAMGSRLEHVATPDYEGVFARWAALSPHEVPGRRGDAVIIHHRLLHAPSLNRSDKIRYAFLCDYQRDDFRHLSTLAPGRDIWEDWPAMAELPSAEKDGAPDIQLAPQGGLVETVPLHSARYQLSTAHTPDTDPSSIRKADASALARSRREKDLWLLLSDNAVTADDCELFPRGSDLSDLPLTVRVDGSPLSSVCRFDLISRLQAGIGRHEVSITGLDRRMWLRVLRIRLPFNKTEFLLKAELGPGDSTLGFSVPET